MAVAPVYIGVATTVTPKLRQGNIKRPSAHYVRLAEAAAKHGAHLYLFHPQHVSWSQGRVMAWMPEQRGNPRGNWVHRTVRIPDVIYENVYVHLTMKGYVTTLRREVRKRHIPAYNPVLPGKWRMVQLLKQAGMSDYTPQTERLRSTEQVKNRIRAWGIVYIKPIGGYGGMGVSRVEQLADGRYRVAVDRTKSQTAHMRRTMSELELSEWIRLKLHRPHILQRGLKLISVGQRKMDFRVVVHRDIHGRWQLIGIVPKMAAADGVVTNIIAGGERSDLMHLQTAARMEGKRIPADELEEQAKQIAQQISNRFPSVGLIGFDMAVEENGQVTMIEMNPKPARSLLSRPMLERLATHTVGFSLYLARRRRRAKATLTGYDDANEYEESEVF